LQALSEELFWAVATILVGFLSLFDRSGGKCPSGRFGTSTNRQGVCFAYFKRSNCMKKILLLFLAAMGLLALIPTESKAGIGIYVEPGYYAPFDRGRGL
jgi:hypothetical protein